MNLRPLRDLVSLTKPRVTALVLATAACGMVLAPGPLSPGLALVTMLATALVVGSANALNCWLERDVDGLMARTRRRPLPAGRLSPAAALAFGGALGLVAVPLLALWVNALTALLGALALVSYVWLYTPMKRRSPAALALGAVPGAMPPLMGWTAVTGRIELPGLVLFAILFLWQMPHFIAISLFRERDYTRAGLKVLPAVRGHRAAKLQAALYAGVLLPVTLLLVPLRVAGTVYLTAALLLGIAFLAVTLAGMLQGSGERWARRLFVTSLAYLPLLFTVLMLDAGS